MTDYPRQIPDGPPGEPPPRHIEGWICLSLIILFVYVGSLSPPKASNQRISNVLEAQTGLHQELVAQSLPKPVGNLTAVEDPLGPLIRNRRTDPLSAEFYVAERTLNKLPIAATDLAPIRNSKDPLDRAIDEIYSAKQLAAPAIPALTRGIDSRGFLGRLIVAQAYMRAGDPRPFNRLKSEAGAGSRLLLLIGTIVLVGSPIACICVAVGWFRRDIRPLGSPIVLRELADSDRFAMRGAQLLTYFLVADVVAALIAFRFVEREAVTSLLVGIFMLVGVVALFRLPLFGQTISLAAIGVQFKPLGRLVGIGVVGFLIEYPIALCLATLGNSLFGRFHQATHPVTTQLSESPSVAYVFAALFMASVAAPFWEEIMFRGLLFPALSKLLKSGIWGALVSSFIFGAIHPQGLPLWLMLMSLGTISCVLSYYSKSLVPSMTLHALHNAATVAFIILQT